MSFVLSLDEGTTSARAAIYDRKGERVVMCAECFESRYPKPGWVEQDGLEIWDAQLRATRAMFEQTRIFPREIVACGITNQRETTRSLGPRLRSARRARHRLANAGQGTADFCAELARSPYGSLVQRKTGLVVDAYFSASKINWILENTPDGHSRANDGEIIFGNIDTWLIWNLTHGSVHATDYTNASRTMLMDVNSGAWDNELLGIFGIPRSMLPEIKPSCGEIGVIAGDIFGAEIPICGIAGDQQAALAGQACFRAGLSKNTYGTGCFALTQLRRQAAFSGQ